MSDNKPSKTTEPASVKPPADPSVPEAPKTPDPRTLHTFHPVLSDTEVRKVRDDARALMEEKQRKKARKEMLDAEIARLEREEGLHTGGEDDGFVDVVIDIIDPKVNSPIAINGQPFFHGTVRNVRRHVARTLEEIMWRLRVYTSREIKGEKDAEFRQNNNGRGRVLSGAGMSV